MTAIVDSFALIGRSFPSDDFQSLHQVSVAARAERRTRRVVRIPTRVWAGAKEPIIVPARLYA